MRSRRSSAAFVPLSSRGVSLNRDGSRLLGFVTEESKQRLRVWDVLTGQAPATPLTDEWDVVEAAFSPDGERIVTSSSNGRVRVWDALTGEPLTPVLSHGGGIVSVRFSQDGRRIFADRQVGTGQAGRGLGGSSARLADGPLEVRVWDASTGQPLTGALRSSGVPAPLLSIRTEGVPVSGDGDRLLLVDGKNVTVCDLSAETRPVDDLLALTEVLACRRVNAAERLQVLEEGGFEARLESPACRPGREPDSPQPGRQGVASPPGSGVWLRSGFTHQPAWIPPHEGTAEKFRLRGPVAPRPGWRGGGQRNLAPVAIRRSAADPPRSDGRKSSANTPEPSKSRRASTERKRSGPSAATPTPNWATGRKPRPTIARRSPARGPDLPPNKPDRRISESAYWRPLLSRLAILRLHLGDQAGYSRICERLLADDLLLVATSRRFGLGLPSIVPYTLAPGALKDPGALIGLLKKEQERRRRGRDRVSASWGRAYYRAGKHEEALLYLGHVSVASFYTAADWFFLAMAQHRSDNPEQQARAKASLARAIERMEAEDRLSDEDNVARSPGDDLVGWARRLMNHMLHREAEAELKKPAGSK